MIHIDYTNMFVKGGIPKAEWTAAKKRFAKAHKEFEARRGIGQLHLPGGNDLGHAGKFRTNRRIARLRLH